MKRAISLILVIILLFSFASCAKKQHGEQQNADSDPTEAPAETATEAATEAPVEEPTDAPEPTDMPAWPEERNDLSRIIQGRDVFFIVRPEGSIYGWGKNDHGQLGTGNKEDKTSPTFIGIGMTPVIVGETVFALGADKKLYGWGRNDAGQLGNGSREDALTPVELMENVKEVYNFWDGYGVLKTDNNLYRWFTYSDSEELSDEQQKERNTPHLEFENVKSVSGQFFLVTGSQELYQLGYEAGGEKWIKLADDVWEVYPGQGAQPLFRDIGGSLYALIDGEKQLVAESFRSVKSAAGVAWVLMNDGKLYSYSLGNSEIIDSDDSETGRLAYVMDGVVKFDTAMMMDEDWGYYDNFALKANGELWAWGEWGSPALGLPRMYWESEPMCVAWNVRNFYTSHSQTYVIENDGRVWGTGYGLDKGFVHGCLGDGTTATRYGFVPVDYLYACEVFPNLELVFTDYDDGTDGVALYSRTYAVDAEGRIYAWGWNGDGFLGVRSADEEILTPTEIFLTRG